MTELSHLHPVMIAPEKAEITAADRVGWQIRLPLEAILIVCLLVFAFVIRLPELDAIPLNETEAAEAFAAYKAIQPGFPGETPISRNPLMFSANLLSMSIGGVETGVTRLPTVIMGVLLTALPLLFRRWLGAAATFILCALLTFSPSLMLASRGMSGAVWSSALALLLVYCIARYAETRRTVYASGGVAALALLLLAAEPAGFLTLFALGVAGVFALSSSSEDRSIGDLIGQIVQGFPRPNALFMALLTLISLGTAFLLYPPALRSVGESLGAGLLGLVERPNGYPVAFPLLVSLIYEPLIWVMGLTGVFLSLFGDQTGVSREKLLIQRGLIGWLVASLAWSLAYGGAQAGHALWLTLPLVGLSGLTIEKMLVPPDDPFFKPPMWGIWLHAAGMVAVLLIAVINLIFLGREILNVAPSLTPILQPDASRKLILVGLALALSVITFFLSGSIWGARAAWRGLGLGIMLVLGAYGFAMGWGGAVTRADDPREPWHVRPASRSLNLLAETLNIASKRDTGQPFESLVIVQQPAGSLAFTYGPLAWTLRHYRNVRYVQELTPALNAPIVIAPETTENPDLGGDYVGQDFSVWHEWNASLMQGWDFVAWLYDRTTRLPPTGMGKVVVWLRADVYGIEGATTPPVIVP